MEVRAAVAFAPGKPLEVTTVKLDGPRAGEVLVEIKATGICHTDEFTLSGADPEGLFPAILGHEGAGIVVDVGPGVTSVKKDDHVIPLYTPECRTCPSCLSRKTNLCTAIRATQGQGAERSWIGRDVIALTRFGGYTDTICVPAKQVFARPAGMSALDGAAIPVNYFTAWQLIVVMGALKRDETMLVHSAGGGVGIAATQIAKHLGARVIGTASASKHAELRALGIDHLIDYRTEDFEARTREITGGRGVELILDAVGGDSWKKGYRVLAPAGRLGMFGVSAAASGKERSVLGFVSLLANTPWFQFNPLSLMNANKGVFGVNLGHMWSEVDRIREWAEGLLDLWAQGVVKPKIARSFRFEEAPQAHHFIQDRRNIGKVLLVP